MSPRPGAGHPSVRPIFEGTLWKNFGFRIMSDFGGGQTVLQDAYAASSAEAWALDFNWYFNRNIKLNLDYEQTQFEGGAATGDREDESIVFSRFQVSF